MRLVKKTRRNQWSRVVVVKEGNKCYQSRPKKTNLRAVKGPERSGGTQPEDLVFLVGSGVAACKLQCQVSKPKALGI